jgi:hypothetical protein
VIGPENRKPPAPTRRLGDGRRRFTLVAVIGGAALVLIQAGCAGPARSPVPAGLIGQVVQRPDAPGPAIECRGIARERCVAAGAIEGEIGGVSITDIARVIVSCESPPCTAAGGAMRIDVLLRDGTTVEVARGGYGEFRQP